MWRRLRLVLSTVTMLAAIGVGPTPLQARSLTDAGEVDLGTIIRRVETWRGSFANLRMVWTQATLPTQTQAPLSDWPLPHEHVHIPPFSRDEWIWADHGLDLLELGGLTRKGDRPSWSVDVFNGPGRVSFRASYATTPEGAVQLRVLDLRGVGVGKPTSSFARLPLHGVYWPGTAEWLPGFLSQANCTVEGFEDLLGARCVRVKCVSLHPNVADVEWCDILWLDWERDCLVRRILSRKIPQRRLGTDFVVDEFQQLDGGIWFPKRGRVQLQSDTEPYSNQMWTVTEAAVNQAIDRKRFQPPRPEPGTLVNGRVHGGG